jgi:hypothetical protein
MATCTSLVMCNCALVRLTCPARGQLRAIPVFQQHLSLSLSVCASPRPMLVLSSWQISQIKTVMIEAKMQFDKLLESTRPSDPYVL